MNRVSYYVLCVLVAVLVWIQVASTTPIEANLPLPLVVENLSDGLTIAGNELPENVLVRLRGSKLRLLAHRYLGRAVGEVVISLAEGRAGATVTHDVRLSDVRSDLTPLAIQGPVHLQLRIDRENRRRVPVRIPTVGELSEERVLVRPLAAVPESVEVRGPARLFTGWEAVRSEAVDLGKLRGSGELIRRLVLPHPGLTLSLPEVRVVFEVGPRGTRHFANVPVVPLVDARQPEASVFPPVAALVVSGPADSLRALVVARLAITVSLTGLGAGTHHLPGQVILPDGYRLVSLQPEQFVVRIGQSDAMEGRSSSAR